MFYGLLFYASNTIQILHCANLQKVKLTHKSDVFKPSRRGDSQTSFQICTKVWHPPIDPQAHRSFKHPVPRDYNHKLPN